MTTPLVLTFVGDDRPGLVNAISQRVADCDATWLESRSAQLAGKFAGVLLVSVPDANLARLESSLRDLEAAGLHITIERGGPPRAESSKRFVTLEIVGAERPGIVRDVTQALGALGVNIEELASGLESAPFSGLQMFRATARLSAPDGLALDDLRRALERLAGEITVDLAVDDDEGRL
jgi:glycine cleavage system regulatory protein